jgi:hypothetical protein
MRKQSHHKKEKQTINKWNNEWVVVGPGEKDLVHYFGELKTQLDVRSGMFVHGKTREDKQFETYHTRSNR